jgi:triosephosphate isomerase|tara:strand:- start:773 stop:1501 length:729 start_codon:yes stop_codon:yes gene_type:complete
MLKLSNFSSFFVANWKLNGNLQFIDQFISNISLPNANSKCVVICPTAIHLDYLSKNKNGFYVGAQNVSEHEEGAYTGEISVRSLIETNVDFCIVGHSERRQIFKEKDQDINLKSQRLVANNVIPIICIGETLEQKEKGITNTVLEEQLMNSIPSSSTFENTIIAYEPVWAIGTGLTPTIDEIDETHRFIRSHNDKFNKYKILYGGSVKASNAKEITHLANVDGALIGGASLKSEEFTKIIQD